MSRYSTFHGDGGSVDFGGARDQLEDQSHHGQGGDSGPGGEDFDRDYEENFASKSSCSRNRRGVFSVYIEGLPDDVLKRDVRKHFQTFGQIVDVRLLRRVQLPIVAFVDFEDERDAQDAVNRSNSFKFEGRILRLEMAVRTNKSLKNHDEKSLSTVNVFGLPKSASWQDLKDHARKLGFNAWRADVSKDFSDYDGCDRHRCHRVCGVLRFASRSETLRAVRRLNGTEFMSREGDTATIRVNSDLDFVSRSRSRTSRTRSRSPLESYSVSRRSQPSSGTHLLSNSISGSRRSRRSRSSSGTQNSFMPMSSLSSRSRSTSSSLISSDFESSSQSRFNRRPESKMRPGPGIDIIELESLTPSPSPPLHRQIESVGGLGTSRNPNFQEFLDDVSTATSQSKSPELQSISSEELEEGETLTNN